MSFIITLLLRGFEVHKFIKGDVFDRWLLFFVDKLKTMLGLI